MKYGFIGCGNMGGAVARAVCKSAGAGDVLLANRTPAKAQALAAELGCACGTNEQVAGICDFIFLGVKPQMMADMLDELAPTLEARAESRPFVLVSMAAGLQPASPGADTLRLCPHDVCLGSLTVTVPIGGQLARVQRQVAKTGRDCTATVMLTLERAVPVTVCLPGQEAYTLCQREITVSYRTEMPLLAQIIQEVDP